jgi:hypothetical protein
MATSIRYSACSATFIVIARLYGKVKTSSTAPGHKNLSTVWKLIKAEVVQMKTVRKWNNPKPAA